MLVDSHCHLDYPDFAQLQDVLARARAVGVGHFLTIGTKLSEFPEVLAIAEQSPDIHCTIGIHPHEAKVELLEDAAPLLAVADHPKVVGFGESGLDYYYNHSPREQQISNFRTHIAAARQTGLPLVVHTRDADDDTIAIVEEEMAKGAFTGVIHCFTGTARLAQAMVAQGFYISASGIATFKKSEAVRAALKDVPLDRLLVETDAPYLAPLPHRGKPNEPAYVVHTAHTLAEVKGVSFNTLADATTENFYRLFPKARAA